jgi:hypothetical protein
MAERVRSVRSPLTVAASTALGLVFLLRLPDLAEAAGYLAIVGAGIAVVSLAGAVRTLAGRVDGRVLAAGAASVAFVGQALNTFVGLPAAQDLRGDIGWAGAVALVCEIVIAFLALRSLRGNEQSAQRR